MTPFSRIRLRTAAAVSVAATSGTLLAAICATPAAAATVTCKTNYFTRTYYANTTFAGTPKKTDCDNVMDQNWVNGAPVSGLPKDNFAVRYSVTRDFGSGGPFTLAASARDGVRVYLDGVRKIDIWKNGSATVSKSVNLTIPSGKHTLRVDYVNWTGAANVKFSYAPRTSKTYDKVKPRTPTGVKAAHDTASGKVKMSWPASVEMDLAGYRVYRRLAGTTTYTQVGSGTATSWTGLNPEPGKTYYYEVRAVDKAGNVSTGSADIATLSPLMTTPTGLAATGTDTGITVAWKPVAGATRYLLNRSGAGTATTVSVTGTSFNDTTVARSAQWQYRVAAVDGAGRTSAYTPATYTAAAAHRTVAAPHSLTATPAASSVTLSWLRATTDGSVSGYHVYRSTTLPVDTTSAPVADVVASTLLADGSRRFTWTDNYPVGSTTYHYVVRAFDSTGKESAAAANVTTTTLYEDLTPPAPVTGLSAEATDYGVELRWKTGAEADIVRQRILVGELVTDEEEGTSVCYALSSVYVGPTVTSYRDVRLPDGEERCYFIDVQDTSGNNSMSDPEANPVVTVVERDLTPTVETPEGSPVTVTGEAGTTGGVQLTWQPVTDATGYTVERWNRVTETYEPIADATSPSTVTTATDRTAAAGTTHFYRVAALYADGTASVPGTVGVVLEPAA
ncbi:fibronectin type III domain-containing protein [Streptomyces sp. NBC_00102]|uniref:fibronectin type III domain-containing protein n=1 Tax=Streptomyces sp. NBC_00102 TaxID=2975652 RepID=UPI00224D2CF8|nr:PA14 domain-containing protein [Streptomyces sp. NBC_00102]MCX5398368.1 PA14 domain-containing protein [Streptomyces sp. NBC_00102]